MRHSRRISSDSGALSLIRRLLGRVYITETHDPSKRDARRDFNREYPDLTVPAAIRSWQDFKFILDQVFRLGAHICTSSIKEPPSILFQGLFIRSLFHASAHTHAQRIVARG